ncbi:unnamed protein product, partial [Mesorhabditis spiculigera]
MRACYYLAIFFILLVANLDGACVKGPSEQTTASSIISSTNTPKACSLCTQDMLNETRRYDGSHGFDNATLIMVDGCATFYLVCASPNSHEPGIVFDMMIATVPLDGNKAALSLWCDEGLVWKYTEGDLTTYVTQYECADLGF